MNYYLKSVDYGLMHIEYGVEVLAALKYKGWSAHEAKLNYPNAEYTFRKANFFGTRRTIYRNGAKIGEISMNWGILIEFVHELEERTNKIKIKPRDFWQKKFEVYINNVHQLTLQRDSVWVRSNFAVEFIDDNISILPKEELMGILGYTLKYYDQMNSG